MANQKYLDKIKALVDDIKVAMLVTAEENGQLRSRPMYTSQYDDDGTIWFFTDEYSGKVEELESEHTVNLAYSHPGKENFLSISGKAYLVTDRRKIEELWNPILKAWFPDGLESENLALLKIVPQKAEFWDTPGNKLVELFNLGKALLTGTKDTSGKHAKVNL